MHPVPRPLGFACSHGTANPYVFDGEDGLLLEVQPQPDTWQRIHDGWDAFMRCVREAQAPPLADRDTRIRDDPEWLSAAAAYLELAGREEVRVTLT